MAFLRLRQEYSIHRTCCYSGFVVVVVVSLAESDMEACMQECRVCLVRSLTFDSSVAAKCFRRGSSAENYLVVADVKVVEVDSRVVRRALV